MSWTKKLLFLGVGLLGSLLVAVLILELALGGWLSRDPWNGTKALNIVRDRSIEYSVDSLYGAGAPKVHYTRDRNGLRGQCADPQQVQVLTIGGSTTDQRYISDGQTFQDVLAARAAEHGVPLHVCNAGVDGHSTFGHLAAFDRWFPLIDGLRPRYVMLYIGINDAGFRLQPMPERDPEAARGLRDRVSAAIREKSALYGLDRTLRAVFQRGGEQLYARHGNTLPPDGAYTVTATTPGVQPLIELNSAGFAVRLGALLERIKAMGARPLCVSQPQRFAITLDGSVRGLPAAFEHEGRSYNGLDYAASKASLDKEMQRLCTAAGGDFIDIASRSFSAGDFYDPVHMTPAGARRLGEYLHEEMSSRGLLDALPAGQALKQDATH